MNIDPMQMFEVGRSVAKARRSPFSMALDQVMGNYAYTEGNRSKLKAEKSKEKRALGYKIREKKIENKYDLQKVKLEKTMDMLLKEIEAGNKATLGKRKEWKSAAGIEEYAKKYGKKAFWKKGPYGGFLADFKDPGSNDMSTLLESMSLGGNEEEPTSNTGKEALSAQPATTTPGYRIVSY